MAAFYETKRGVKFYDSDVPRIATALERIASALEKQQPKQNPLFDKMMNDIMKKAMDKANNSQGE